MEGPDRLSTTLLEADQPGGIGNLAAARAPEDVEKNENLQGTVITFGTFDLFHLGHLLILERAAQFGDKLIVGVSSDALTLKKKGKKPVFDESTRVQLVQSLKCVAKVFIEHSLEEKREYCVEHGAEVFVMGDDHVGRFDAMLEGVCRCHYLPRTKGVSSTDLEIILQERLNLGGGLDKAQKELLEKSVYDSMIPHGKSTAKFSTTSSTTIVSKSSSNKSSESISKSIESSAGVRSESSRDEIGRVSGEGRVSSGSDEDEQPSPVAAEKKTELTEENLKSWSQARMRRSRESVRNIFPGSPSSLRNEHPGTPSSQQVGDADESRDRAADSKPHGSCDADSTQLTHAARSQPHQSQHTDGKSSGGGSGNFLTACNIAVENLMYFLVYLHDVYYLWIQWMCAPVCKRVPREVRGVTVFTANTVTYARTLLVLVICFLLKSGGAFSNVAAAFLVMFHDFLDHVDGVVAKVQREDGRAKNDDGRWGGFVDAQCDKIVFCTSLWTLLMLNEGGGASFGFLNVCLNLSCFVLILLELAIAWVRTRDYFQAVYDTSSSKQGALRAVSEGKLKQKMESCGVAVLCLVSPNAAAFPVTCTSGIVLLTVGIYFAYKSLEHKLRHSVA